MYKRRREYNGQTFVAVTSDHQPIYTCFINKRRAATVYQMSKEETYFAS